MNTKNFIYIAATAFTFLLLGLKSHAQEGKSHQRQVTINQTVVDGKVISSDTMIIESDTVRRTINSKEVSTELAYTKGTTIHIDNAYRKINIRQSKDNQVRLVTTAFYYGEPAFTNEQWLEKLNIQVKNTDTGITIISGIDNRGKKTDTWNNAYRAYTYASGVTAPPTPALAPVATATTGVRKSTATGSGTTVYGYATTGGGYTRSNWSSSGNGVAVFDNGGTISYNSSSQKNEMILYIPTGAKVDVASRYGDVSVDHDLTYIKAHISNASLDMLNAGNARISGVYSNITTGNVDNADIEMTSGKLSMKDVKQLQLHTRYTKVEAGNCGILQLQSISDDYDIDEVKKLSGQKTYGSLRVDKLTGSFDLKGTSADLKIRNIEPTASTITIDNKYADVRLPVATLKNYEVLFSGNYSSVFAPFERKDTAIEKETAQTPATTVSGTTYATGLRSYTSRRSNNAFTAATGDIKGTHTIFNLTCTSCNVDFK